ncbi:hypothetical protein L6452_17200 [Arctium lappa]|uniref:Uncharacterized protein n=1 Tax=Arctium lappa TaxID=4217 RepID=A0ACB9C313_ARCLA|nr:hypothetical protein L6452_17200 [Arctium lappa]
MIILRKPHPNKEFVLQCVHFRSSMRLYANNTITYKSLIVITITQCKTFISLMDIQKQFYCRSSVKSMPPAILDF